MSRRAVEVSTDLLLKAYRLGLFPMAETRQGDRIYWLDPEQRGVIPLSGFHLPRRLLRTVLAGPYRVTADTAFAATIAACAQPAPGREDTWINPTIEQVFIRLHEEGHAHSVETWAGEELVGGLYGIAIGGAFFGESMFSTHRDASKVALVHLIARLRLGGFRLLDTQFVTTHLRQFGATEVPRAAYKSMLAEAVAVPATWLAAPDPARLETEIRALGFRTQAA
jgi:leucyl/phenylalanyl-tRNA--protein transferase